MPVTRQRCTGQVSRRPRGICPICRHTLSLCWSGEIKVLRKHSVSGVPCTGSGLPALGELPEIEAAEIELAGPTVSSTTVPAPSEPAPQDTERVASVA
jgi:hypothetical protein